MNSVRRASKEVGSRCFLLARSFVGAEPFNACALYSDIRPCQPALPGSRVFSTKKTRHTDVQKEPIEHVRARIFGNHIGDGLRSGRKILARPLIGSQVASYYPPDWFAGDPLLLDLEAERKKSKLSRLSRRGKSPPKKGAGKRSSKK